MLRSIWALAVCVVACPAAAQSTDGEPKGEYRFAGWDGAQVGVHYYLPPNAGPETRVLIVIPGAKRNADAYRDQWEKLALANEFIVLAVEGAQPQFPTEYEYNAGGVVSRDGDLMPESKWTFSVIKPLFDDFKKKFGSRRESYSLYGHSAGGGFVHRFMLFKPDARVDVAIAANPAFVTMPDLKTAYPFGLQGSGKTAAEIQRWFSAPLVILLADRDRGPRTKPLSNGPEANLQGPNVFSRGLLLYQSGLKWTFSRQTPLNWRLDIVHDVGHSNTHMASHAMKYLFKN